MTTFEGELLKKFDSIIKHLEDISDSLTIDSGGDIPGLMLDIVTELEKVAKMNNIDETQE